MTGRPYHYKFSQSYEENEDVCPTLPACPPRWHGMDGDHSIRPSAMVKSSSELFRQAAAKAETAYGQAVRRVLAKAVHRLRQRDDRLERGMAVLAMTLPKALVRSNIRSLLRS